MLEAELLNSSIELDGEINSNGQIDGNIDTSAKDYRKLSHLPYINGVKVEGNLSLEDLGIENYDDSEIKKEITNLQEEINNIPIQVYKGSNTPDSDVLIWIDTSGETPIVVENKLTTKDGLEFLTKDNENFILKEEL